MLMALPEATSWARAAIGQTSETRVTSSDSRAARFSSSRLGRARMAGRVRARLDQLAAFTQQDQPLFLIDADQHQPAGRVQYQGLDDLQPPLAPLGAEPGQQLRRIAAPGPGGQTDQAKREGQAEDRPGKIKKGHEGSTWRLESTRPHGRVRGQRLTVRVNVAFR